VHTPDHHKSIRKRLGLPECLVFLLQKEIEITREREALTAKPDHYIRFLKLRYIPGEKMNNGKILTIQCKCGLDLFRYFKAGKGRIIKCFLKRMTDDYVGLHNCENYSKPQCPQCGKELGIIMMIRGEPALKLNQGTIKPVRV
jgi:hypothetical protein